MYARIIKNCSNLKWGSVLMPSIQLIRPITLHPTSVRSRGSVRVSIRSCQFSSLRSTSGCRYDANPTRRSGSCLKRSQFRAFSSEGDGRSSNTSEDKCDDPLNGSSKLGDGKVKVGGGSGYCNTHARLAEQDQREWLDNEKLAIEAKKKESPFLTRRERFRNDFLRRVVPWENIQVSWESFPYPIKETTKNVLLECVASHLKCKNLATSYGSRLTSSSGRILLQSSPGTELYRERIVRALARKLQVPMLVLGSSALAPYDLDDLTSDIESGDEGTSDSDVDEDNEAANTEEGSTEDEVIDLAATDDAIRKLIPFDLEEFEKVVSEESEALKSDTTDPSDNSKRPLKKGDRVKYIGSSKSVEADNRPLSNGQRGEVLEINGNQAAVVWEMEAKKGDVHKEHEESSGKSPVFWINVEEIAHDPDAEGDDCYLAMDALYEILQTEQPLIVYFPDFFVWLFRAVPKSNRKEFVHKLLEMLDKLSGSVVLICGHNTKVVESGSKEKEKFPLPLKTLAEGLRGTQKPSSDEFHKLFPNVLRLDPPKDDNLLITFNKQIEEDRKIVISRSNLYELHKVLDENEMLCPDLLDVDTDGLVLTKQKAEKIVGWAKNHHLSSCEQPSIEKERLVLPRESLEAAILRGKDHEISLKKPSQDLKACICTSKSINNMAKDEFETNFVSAVVPPGEIGVRFDDVGALEDVKKALNELVILPMRRPELFTHGNLLRPCKGILLFGPPGTGKTLLAKALATEAGANFISITGSNLTSKWFGDAEKLTKALFSFASKLAPVIIFIDEVDSLLGARGGSHEHEATRRMRNEFMAAWDGLRSKDTQRIVILGATNRPFDLDDAVIRRLPRRIYVDLPDAANRNKILKIILGKENLHSEFQFEELANATDGYSGSDLKNLCIAAAYRPVQEILENENKGNKDEYVEGSSLRPLTLDDFIQAKAKVGPSVSHDAASMNELRKWNEQYGEGGSRRKSSIGF
ncbi:Outer mitochondrial transmembrane helix translocase [Linum grandiflorum]